MIVSAVSLWKKFNTKAPLCASEWGIDEQLNTRFSHVSFSGHAVEGGSVRIYARYGKPVGKNVKPAVLLLGDAGKSVDTELMQHFIDLGYAVLMPDYSGKMQSDGEGVLRTIYPTALEHGNLEKARGLKDMAGLAAHETTWFEWTYVALFAIEFLRSQEDIGNIGVVGVRTGGDIAWQVMLSPEIKCGVPINAVGWHSFEHIAKFGDNVAHNLSDDTHRYIAAVEAQSYAPSVKCPVLLLCALHDNCFDCDRAYDTYSRIGNTDGNALVYSGTSGACIGPNGINDMDLFLEKNLKGREIYIPDTLNVSMKETDEGLEITVECDKEGILEEAGVYYAEADVKTRCAYRDFHRVLKKNGKSVVDGKVSCVVKPFAGAKAAFAYAYAKYINGFRVTSKITCKRLSNPDPNAVKGRMLFSGWESGCFTVENYGEYSIGDIFLEREAIPKRVEGYGGVVGAYSVGGIRTYKISSPMYVPDENAMLAFDAYFPETEKLKISVEAGDVETETERYTCAIEVKGGGKWKRIILRANDFKGENSLLPLGSFADGRALLFDCDKEGLEYAVANVLWL